MEQSNEDEPGVRIPMRRPLLQKVENAASVSSRFHQARSRRLEVDPRIVVLDGSAGRILERRNLINNKNRRRQGEG